MWGRGGEGRQTGSWGWHWGGGGGDIGSKGGDN